MNEVEINGNKYSAVDVLVPGRCVGCSFRDGFGCELARARIDGLAVPDCSSKYREDSRDVIFVLSASLK